MATKRRKNSRAAREPKPSRPRAAASATSAADFLAHAAAAYHERAITEPEAEHVKHVARVLDALCLALLQRELALSPDVARGKRARAELDLRGFQMEANELLANLGRISFPYTTDPKREFFLSSPDGTPSQSVPPARGKARAHAVRQLVDQARVFASVTVDGNTDEKWTPRSERPAPLLWSEHGGAAMSSRLMVAAVERLFSSSVPISSRERAETKLKARIFALRELEKVIDAETLALEALVACGVETKKARAWFEAASRR